MKKTLIALVATAPLALLAAWTANAYPISPSSPSSSNLVEQVGCAGGPSPEDRCPDDRYYEPRRYPREYY
jgi:hypothetical protein